MIKEEKTKKKEERKLLKAQKKAERLARKEERRIAKLKAKGKYVEPEKPSETEIQEETQETEVDAQIEEQEEEIQEGSLEEENEPVLEETQEGVLEQPAQKKKKPAKQYHISLRVDQKWQLKYSGSSKPIKLFNTQKEAIDYAKPLATKQKATLVIHRVDGKIRKQDYTKK